MTYRQNLALALRFESAVLEIHSKLPTGTFALAGGLAVSLWTPSQRPTEDLDFVLLTQDTSKLRKQFPICLGEDLRIYIARIQGIEVDFLKPAGFDWNQLAIRKANQISIFGILLPVVTPEYLVLYKMSAQRNIADERDVMNLLKIPGVADRSRKLVAMHLSPQHVEELEQLQKEATLY